MKKRALILLPLVALVYLSIGGVKSDFALIRDTEIMINMMRALNENYVDTLSTSRLLQDATGGMSRSLDPYTTYINEEDMADFEIMTTGKYGGIGAVIRQSGDYIAIAQPYKGSPADEGGLLIGDRILEVDGNDAHKLSVSEVSSLLKGTPGSRVEVVLRSVIDSTKRKVTLRRRRISIPAVPYYDILGDGVGYLQHSDFTDGGYEEIRTALINLRDRGMSSLILDYRGNGGGVMQEAVKVLSLFVPKGSEVLKIKGRQDSTIYKTTSSPLFEDLKMVVLIDQYSASASEIVAGALQDMDRAVLLGQRSFGKGLVQSTIPVGYDSYLKLTTARYYIPSGRCIQALDYTDHSADRKIERVVDSLRSEFFTANGRSVYDGGGVNPDVEVEKDYVSRFAATLYAQGLVEEWGEEYFRQHHKEPIDAKSFKVSDEDFESFESLLEGRDIEFESLSTRALKALERAAEEDRNEELTAQIESIKESIKDDVQSNLRRYREEVERYLTQDIVLRFSYADGVLSNNIANDNDVARAKEILTTEGEIERLLSPTTEITPDPEEVE